MRKRYLPLTLKHLVQQLHRSIVEPSKQFVSFLQLSVEHGLHPRTPPSVMTASQARAALATIRIWPQFRVRCIFWRKRKVIEDVKVAVTGTWKHGFTCNRIFSLLKYVASVGLDYILSAVRKISQNPDTSLREQRKYSLALDNLLLWSDRQQNWSWCFDRLWECKYSGNLQKPVNIQSARAMARYPSTTSGSWS